MSSKLIPKPSWMNIPRFDRNEFSEPLAFELSSVMLPPSPMPTFSELVEMDLAEQNKPRAKDPGLFETLLGSPEPLYYDALENPSNYDEETQALLEEMVRGKKELSPEEERLLNQAVLDWASSTKPKPQKKLEKKPGKTKSEKKEPPAPEEPVPGVDYPEGEMKPFWWL